MEQEEKQPEEIKYRDGKERVKFICNAGVYIFLLFFMVFYSFYAPEGYIRVATNKYLFFRKMSEITLRCMFPFVLLYYLIPSKAEKAGLAGRWESFIKNISATDLFVLLFVLVNCVSYICTDFPEEALWGTDGWYMGFIMQLVFAGIYFLMSRFYDGKIDLFIPFMLVTIVLFLWGLCNRFSVYPIEMEYSCPEYISSMGNINWFCGFWSVFFSMGTGLYIVTKETGVRFLALAHMLISLGLGVVEGSDSGFPAMGVVFLLFFFVAFQKTEYMKRFLESGIVFCCACQIMRLINMFWPDRMNLHSFLGDIMLGNLTLGMLTVLITVRLLLEAGDKRASGEEVVRKYKWLEYGIVGVIIGALVLYILLIVINTKYPGRIKLLANYSQFFLFDKNWGNGRKVTWGDGIFIFLSFPPIRKLFGAGPDCFAAYAYSIPELAVRLEREWVGQRLTNAHNECITILVNLGISGLAAFIGMFASSFIRLVKRAVREPVCYVFAASLLSYFIHNQFSFSQILNTPYIFMMLGLGESMLRRSRLKGNTSMVSVGTETEMEA